MAVTYPYPSDCWMLKKKRSEDNRRNLELELQAAQNELESLTESASPSRLERALARLAAARAALELVA